jgi:hypothetical protein
MSPLWKIYLGVSVWEANALFVGSLIDNIRTELGNALRSAHNYRSGYHALKKVSGSFEPQEFARRIKLLKCIGAIQVRGRE